MPPKAAFARGAFKPQRPAKPTTNDTSGRPSVSKSTKAATSKASAPTLIDSSDADDDAFDDSILDDIDVHFGAASSSKAAAISSSSQSEPAIPRDLLVRMLHEHFEKPDTRITKDAADVLARYMELFVQEAMARAARENRERGGDGFLEVQDLERIAPQLLMDF